MTGVAIRKVTVMADYRAFPLWSGERNGMLSPDALQLTDVLRDELVRWSADYDRWLSANGYCWPSEQVQTDWNERGYALAGRVAQELGSSYKVVFFDELLQRTVAVTA